MRISTTDFTDFLESRIICKIDQYVGMNNSWQEQQVRQLSEHDQVPSFNQIGTVLFGANIRTSRTKMAADRLVMEELVR